MSNSDHPANIDQLLKIVKNIEAFDPPEFREIDRVVESAVIAGELEYDAGEFVSIEKSLRDLAPSDITLDLSEIENQGYFICKSALNTLKCHLNEVNLVQAIKPLTYSLERIRATPEDGFCMYEPIDDAGLIVIKPIYAFSDQFAAITIVDKIQSKVYVISLIDKTESKARRDYFNSFR